MLSAGKVTQNWKHCMWWTMTRLQKLKSLWDSQQQGLWSKTFFTQWLQIISWWDSRHQVMYVGCTSYRNLQTTSSQCISCSNKTFAGVQKLMGIYNGFTKYSATCTRSFLCLLTEVLPYFFSQIWIGSHSYLWDHPGGPVSVKEKPSWSKGHLHGHQTHRPLFKFVVLVIHNYNSTCHI